VNHAKQPGTGVFDHPAVSTFSEISQEGILHAILSAVAPSEEKCGVREQLGGVLLICLRHFVFQVSRERGWGRRKRRRGSHLHYATHTPDKFNVNLR
jgi:hypothetical protein